MGVCHGSNHPRDKNGPNGLCLNHQKEPHHQDWNTCTYFHGPLEGSRWFHTCWSSEIQQMHALSKSGHLFSTWCFYEHRICSPNSMIHLRLLGKEHVAGAGSRENFCEEPKRLTENPWNIWQDPSMTIKLDRLRLFYYWGYHLFTEYLVFSEAAQLFCKFLAEKLPASTSCLLLSCCKPLFSSESPLLVILVLQLQYESNQQRIDRFMY